MHKNTRIASFDLEDRTTTLKSNSKNGLYTDMPIIAKTTVMIVGFDWGTNKSCIQASFADSNEPVVSQVVPTVVGYANEGIVENLLPGNAKVLFGAEAIKNRLHLRLVQPMTDGVIDDLSAARDFARHIRSLINPPEDAELRAVIGLPANAERSARLINSSAGSAKGSKGSLVFSFCGIAPRTSAIARKKVKSLIKVLARPILC